MALESDTRMPFPAPKKWERVDVGETECYVGDRLYVLALVENPPETIEELKANQSNTENMVIKYMQSEGFIEKEYVYVGMQRFNLKNPPKGFIEDDGTASA